MVQAMIAAGVDINKSIGEGQTALFMSLLAPDAGQPVDDRCAIALLKAGADSSLRHESGAMPIHLAAGCNYLSALQALLERRPQDVDAQTNIGITPLMMAATEGHPDAVKLLLKFGANPGIKDQEGVTAKEVAIKNGNGQLAQMLS
jgi:ankyrin repeat protein